MPTSSLNTSTGRFRMAVSSINESRKLGAGLRRVLFEEIKGYAAVAASIEGVSHEFETLPGLREDSLHLLQNISRIRISADSGNVEGSLDSSDSAITAGKLSLTNGRVTNPDLTLAHLSPGARMTARVLFELGTGFKPAGKAPEGFIPLDADFNPIRNVAVTPGADSLEIVVETDGSIAPETALDEALQKLGEALDYESLPLEETGTRPSLQINSEFNSDPFAALEPSPAMEMIKSSYDEFLGSGIPNLLDMLFPLLGRTLGSEEESSQEKYSGEGRRIDLVRYKFEEPVLSPDECLNRGETYEARLVVKLRFIESSGNGLMGLDQPGKISEMNVDMGTIPVMLPNGSLVIRGCRRVAVSLMDEDLRVHRVGDLLMRELENVISRMKPVLEDRLSTAAYMSPDILNMLPLTATVHDVLLSSDWCQYEDETNLLASVTHKTRVVSTKIRNTRFKLDPIRMLKSYYWGRLCYLETPEGPNAGLIHTLCHYAKVNEEGQIMTPYRVVKEGRVSDKLVYLAPQEDADYRIADAAAAGEDGKLVGEEVRVRYDDDIIFVPAGEVQLVSVSPVHSLSPSSSLIPFLGHDDPNRALMASNMMRQAVPLIESEQPLVKSGVEVKAAQDSGATLIAKREGKVVEVSGSRIVILSGTERDVYQLTKFRRSNQATCINQEPVVEPGQMVAAGQLLADENGTKGGELALGRNVLTAYMPFKGYNFEDAICISDELVRMDAFTSIHLEWYETATGDADVWTVPVGTRVNHGDVLVQELGGKKRVLLTAQPFAVTTVVKSLTANGRAKVMLAEKRNINAGDKFAGRHGNKGVVAKILPRSLMPYMEDGTPVQMVVNTMGVLSRMNVGQILETHYGMLAKTLDSQFVIPPFLSPSDDLLRKKLAEAGLNEDGMVRLYDGETGTPFESPVTVGYLYMMKLNHLVEDKIHAVSTASQSILTHQPSYGGQRLGFLEMWALESSGSEYTLQEALTIKSDDIAGREKAALSILAGEDIEPGGEGQSLKMLEDVLRSIGISVEEER